MKSRKGIGGRPKSPPCPNHPHKRGNSRGLCFTCRQRELRQGDPERMRKHSERCYRTHIQRTYGITEEQYASLLASQNGVCKLCQQPPKQKKRLQVDHCHKTNEIRGLLCQDCNLMVGHIDANSDRIAGVMRYLRVYPVLAALGIPERYATEINLDFLRGMCARMATSFEKYGPIVAGYPDKVNAIESLKVRLHKYEQTGNLEYLQDLSNFAMIEATLPRHPLAHFKAEDSSASPGRVHNTGVVTQAANTLEQENTRVGGFYKRDGD